MSTGYLRYPVDQAHKISSKEISRKAREIIVILTISNNGKKKLIRFLRDGNDSMISDVSEYLKGDRLFPAVVLSERNQQITTIPIDQIKKRTLDINQFIKEYQQQRKINNDRNDLLNQNEKMMSDFENRIFE